MGSVFQTARAQIYIKGILAHSRSVVSKLSEIVRGERKRNVRFTVRSEIV